jgi:outer membrane protein
MHEMLFPRHSAFPALVFYGLAACVALALAANGRAQLPSAPSAPWVPPSHLNLQAPPAAAPLPFADAQQPLSLADLINIAERRNPETRAAWERARNLLARKGIARAALYPTLTGLVIGESTRNGILFNTEFVRQTEGILEPALELDYTVFDWNERVDALRAARYDLFAGDYAFNNTHLQVIDSVTRSYFHLLDSEGQVAAAEANLKNAQTVAEQVNARLNNGLATLPDALEARAATAQAAYELASLQGAESIAQANLATTLRLPASTALPTVPLDQLAPADALAETVDDATARALHDRPDLLEQEAKIAAADWRIHEARTAYLPQIFFSGQEGRARAFGEQDQLPGVYAAVGVWNAQLNLKWTLFDGGLRSSWTSAAVAEKAAAQAELDADRDRIEDQVWTAYTKAQTAFSQQQAAAALLQAAQVSYTASVQSYGDGVRTLVDVVTAQRTLAQARSEEITARTNAFLQTATLAYRTGELLGSHGGPATLPPGKANAPFFQPLPAVPQQQYPNPFGTVPAPSEAQPSTDSTGPTSTSIPTTSEPQ